MAISAINLSYTDIMANSEYIRARTDPSRSSLLSLPIDGSQAVLTFLHAGRSHWPSADGGSRHHAERGHHHPVYHAVLYTGGQNTMIHNGVIHPCSRGTLVLTDPGCTHEYRPQDPGGAEFLELTFDVRIHRTPYTGRWTDLFRAWFGDEFPETEWPISVPPPHAEHIEAAMSEVVAALMDDSSYRESAAALALGRFALLLVRYLESGIPTDIESQDRLERARRVLERDFASPVSVADLSEVACLSEGAFIRAFSHRFGMPPMAYRKMLRITAARHLLTVSGRPIGEIAANVGYRDIYSFSRAFKSVAGMSASEWRQKGD